MGPRRIFGRPTSRKLTVTACSAFSIALGLLLLMSSGFHFTRMVSKTPRVGIDASGQVGEIRFARNKDGSCRVIKFNNYSDQFGEEKTIDCETHPTPHGHLVDAFESFRKGFNSR
jgi:hypothetical protein